MPPQPFTTSVGTSASGRGRLGGRERRYSDERFGLAFSVDALESLPAASLLAGVESVELVVLDSEEPDSEELFCSRWRFLVP